MTDQTHGLLSRCIIITAVILNSVEQCPPLRMKRAVSFISCTRSGDFRNNRVYVGVVASSLFFRSVYDAQGQCRDKVVEILSSRRGGIPCDQRHTTLEETVRRAGPFVSYFYSRFVHWNPHRIVENLGSHLRRDNLTIGEIIFFLRIDSLGTDVIHYILGIVADAARSLSRCCCTVKLFLAETLISQFTVLKNTVTTKKTSPEILDLLCEHFTLDMLKPHWKTKVAISNQWQFKGGGEACWVVLAFSMELT